MEKLLFGKSWIFYLFHGKYDEGKGGDFFLKNEEINSKQKIFFCYPLIIN